MSDGWSLGLAKIFLQYGHWLGRFSNRRTCSFAAGLFDKMNLDLIAISSIRSATARRLTLLKNGMPSFFDFLWRLRGTHKPP
jgi:hypothetical protein